LAGGLWGLALGLATNGFTGEGFAGVLAGVYFPFAGFGADTTVMVQAGDGGLVWASSGLVLTPFLMLGLLAWSVLRFGLRRTGAPREERVAFAVKVTGLVIVTLAVIAGVATPGDFEEGPPASGFQVVASAGIGEAVWWMFLLFGVVGAYELVVRHGMSSGWWSRWSRLVEPLRAGLLAWGTLVIVLGAGAVVGAVALADGTSERVAAVIGGPLVVGNAGQAAEAVALGASVDRSTFFEEDPAVVDGHVSLFHWGLPPDDDAGAALAPLWLVLVLPPLAVGWATWRTLSRAPRTDAQGVLGVGFGVTAGFALASWFGALMAPLVVVGLAIGPDFDDLIARELVARPSVAAVLGLALLWGLVGAGIAAALWARGAGLNLLGVVPPAEAPSAETPPPRASCSACDASVSADSAFCHRCGAALEQVEGGESQGSE
jgi:hypothetical protein